MRSTRGFLRKDVVQKRRKRAMLRAFWLGFLSLISISSAIFALHTSPLKIVSYSIEGVVEGNEKVIRQVVDEYIHNGGNYLIPLDTFFTFPTQQIQHIISEDHLVSDVNVRRKFTYPFQILISVSEKKITHAVCIEGEPVASSACDWYGLDDEGYAVKKIQAPTTTGSSTVYMTVDNALLKLNDQDSPLGKQVIYPDVIQVVLAYTQMLSKHGYQATSYELFDIKTYIHIRDNGYVIIPYGLTTKPELEINKIDIEEKVAYLESVLTDPSLSKSLYSSSTVSTVSKNSKATSTKRADMLRFEYIDARLAKKIFIDPKNGDSSTSTKSTSTASTTTKPN